MSVRAFEERDAPDVMRLAAAEGWPSLSFDLAQTIRALTAPGVLALVAVANDRVVGYAQALSDGVTTTYLSTIAIESGYRGQHLGEELIEAIFRRSGVDRIDLLSEPESEGFYRRSPHGQKPGYRIYPRR